MQLRTGRAEGIEQEVGGQRSDVRRQRTAKSRWRLEERFARGWRQETEVGGQKSEIRGQHKDRGRRSEVRDQRAENRGQGRFIRELEN